MSETIRIAGVQMDIRLGAPETNLANLEAAVGAAAAEGARLVVFPESAVAGYCFDSEQEARRFAEPIPGPTTERVADWCRRHDAHVALGLIESGGGNIYNACVLVGPDGSVVSYRKTHLPFLGLDRFTTPGEGPYEVHAVGPLRVGLLICYDASFPEASRVLSLAGADLILLPTNWPPGAECKADCTVSARALENHVYFMAVNRIGQERGFRFIGRSKVAGPDGLLLDRAEHTEPAILYADVDYELARNKKIIRVPGKHEIHRFRDRRPELYGRLCE